MPNTDAEWVSDALIFTDGFVNGEIVTAPIPVSAMHF